MTSGEQDALICEIKDLLRRINNAKESGYNLPHSMRSDIIKWHCTLLQDKQDHDQETRQKEAIAKAQATEVAKLAPKVTLMKLTGYSTYLSWIYQAKSIPVQYPD